MLSFSMIATMSNPLFHCVAAQKEAVDDEIHIQCIFRAKSIALKLNYGSE